MQIKPFLYSNFLLIAFLAACNSGNQQREETAANHINADTTIANNDTTTEVGTNTEVSNQDSIPLTLAGGTIKQQGMMEKGKHVVFSFDVPKAGKLTASVKPGETNGNVRIAQIFMPDNTADGPFGMEMTYDLKQTGQYRLVVSENQMAGDPYNGPFTLTLKVE